MPIESGGSQFLDTGTAFGLFALAIVLVLKTILPLLLKFKSNNPSESVSKDHINTLHIAIAKIAEITNEIYLYNKDLHKWHAPKVDPRTNQPIFHWYENIGEIKEILKEILEKVSEEKN